MVPGGHGRSEGSLKEREQEEKEKEEREEEEEGEEEAIESIESDTDCSLWEQKTNKQRLERAIFDQKKSDCFSLAAQCKSCTIGTQ